MKNRKRRDCMLWLVLLCLSACGQDSDIYLEEYEENTVEAEIVDAEYDTFEDLMDTQESSTKLQDTICYVYICGAVEKAGVYMLPEGSRIYEVIEAAGGLTEDADETLVNQAEFVTDGMMIRIYTREEAAELEAGVVSDTDAADGKVDINTASVSELMTIPGIGNAKAEAIVSYREEYGFFSDIEDLMKIPGIKEGIFQQMREHIKVNK